MTKGKEINVINSMIGCREFWLRGRDRVREHAKITWRLRGSRILLWKTLQIPLQDPLILIKIILKSSLLGPRLKDKPKSEEKKRKSSKKKIHKIFPWYKIQKISLIFILKAFPSIDLWMENKWTALNEIRKRSNSHKNFFFQNFSSKREFFVLFFD